MDKFNASAEQSLLGALMLNASAFDDVASIVSESDFADPEHAAIWRAIAENRDDGRPVDPITLADKIPELRKGSSLVYLFELAKETPSAANTLAYAKAVKGQSAKRRVLGIAHRMAVLASEGHEAQTLVDFAQSALNEITEAENQNGGPENIRQIAKRVIDAMQERHNNPDIQRGLKIGFRKLDERLDGLKAGDLAILAARPSMGKTTLAMNIAENVTLAGGRVLVFSMEMTSEQLVERSLASVSEVGLKGVRAAQFTQEGWAKLGTGGSKIRELDMLIDQTPALSITQMRVRARREHRRKPLSLIVVDYLQLGRAEGADSRESEIAAISRGLKAIAKELGVPVIALSQLNRKVDDRTDHRPRLSDLRESGAIEQDADVVMFLYREKVYNESVTSDVAEVIFAKFRNGETGTDYLSAILSECRFADMDHNVVHIPQQSKPKRKSMDY